jgi:hypothetical protein
MVQKTRFTALGSPSLPTSAELGVAGKVSATTSRWRFWLTAPCGGRIWPTVTGYELAVEPGRLEDSEAYAGTRTIRMQLAKGELWPALILHINQAKPQSSAEIPVQARTWCVD